MSLHLFMAGFVICAAVGGDGFATRYPLEPAPNGQLRVGGGLRVTGLGLAIAEHTPVGWVACDDGSVTAPDLQSPLTHLWLVPRDLPARLRPDWPDGAPFVGTVNAVGPAARTAWVNAGSLDGVCLGESWLYSVNRQPTARLVVRHVEPALCHCEVVALAQHVPIDAGRVVERWPTPAQLRRGQAASRVCHVQADEARPLAWIAAVPGIDAGSEPNIDFYSDRRFVGFGVVERFDDRFWYARITVVPEPVPTSEPAPAPQVGPPTFEAWCPLRVGDTAVVRTTADVQAGRAEGRVFDAVPDGWLVNLGEDAGVVSGQVLQLYRGRDRIGEAEVGRVQRSYAVVKPKPSVEELARGDVLRVRPIEPAQERVVGVVERVVGRTVLVVATRVADPPLQKLLTLRDDEGVCGVAMLVEVRGTTGVGFVVPRSTAESAEVPAGAHLVESMPE